MAIQGLDTDGDGAYSKEELDPLAKVNVESLKEFGYFTFVHLSDDDKSLPLKEPVGYSIDYDKTLLTLHFTLPLEKPLDPKVHDVAVDVYDPSFFVAFGFATDAPVKITGTSAPGCAAEIQKPDPENEADAKALERSLLQPARAELEFRLAIRPDGDHQMLDRPDPRGPSLHRLLGS